MDEILRELITVIREVNSFSWKDVISMMSVIEIGRAHV